MSLELCERIWLFGFNGEKETRGDRLERGDAERDGSGDDVVGDKLCRLLRMRGTEAISFCGSACMIIGGRTPCPAVDGGE